MQQFIEQLQLQDKAWVSGRREGGGGLQASVQWTFYLSRKDYVKKELETGKAWEKKWGFLPAQYQEVSRMSDPCTRIYPQPWKKNLFTFLEPVAT